MNEDEHTHDARRMRAFFVTWCGQLISFVGSGVSAFAVAVHLLKTSDSVTPFALMTFFQTLPMMLLSPIAGVLIDRWDRRRAMLLADIGGMLTMGLLLLFVTLSEAGVISLQPWHFYVPVVLGSCFGAFHLPAFLAATALLVPKQHLPRANALIDLAAGVAQISAPLLAAIAFSRIGLRGIIFFDLLTFVFATMTLLAIRFREPPKAMSEQLGVYAIWQEMRQGLNFIRERKGLWHLLCFVASLNLAWSFCILLVTPLVLSFADVQALGWVQTISGLGMLGGGIFMSVWGGPKRRVHGVLGFALLSAFVLPLAALPANVPLVAIASAVFLFSAPPLSSSAQTIWQLKVPPRIQGRVFAMRRVISLSAMPIAGLVAGPLADDVLGPCLMPGGILEKSVGRYIGTGPGRGIAFMFIIVGGLLLAAILTARRSKFLMNVETDLPDATLSNENDAPMAPKG